MTPETQYLTIPDLVDLFGSTPSKIRRLIEDNYLAAIRIDGVLQIPVDFIDGREPLPSLRGTLLALHDAGFNNDEAVAWLFADNDELGKSPIKTLKSGNKSAVRRATQGLAY